MAVLKLILPVCGQIRKHSERFFHLSLSLVDPNHYKTVMIGKTNFSAAADRVSALFVQ
jgi:hypothetical protein